MYLRHLICEVQVCQLREGIGSATNNVAEYRAFILGLRGALERGIYRFRVQGDSKLVCEQVRTAFLSFSEGSFVVF